MCMRDSSPLNNWNHISRSTVHFIPPESQRPALPAALPTPAFLRLKDVMRVTALSRPTLYRRIAAQRFPRPVHLGGRACGWASSELAAWIRDPEGYRAPGTPSVRRPVPVPRSPCRGRPLKYPEFRGR
jgi:prophage regulatory protein